jgi:hypothetical protein
MPPKSKQNARSIYLPLDVLSVLDKRAGDDPLSNVIARRLRRYESIIAKTKLPLSEAELSYVANAIQGFQATTPDHLLAIPGLIKAYANSGADRPPGVDPNALPYRIESAAFPALVAVVEAIERRNAEVAEPPVAAA